jgi:hypothetical protein
MARPTGAPPTAAYSAAGEGSRRRPTWARLIVILNEVKDLVVRDDRKRDASTRSA